MIKLYNNKGIIKIFFSMFILTCLFFNNSKLIVYGEGDNSGIVPACNTQINTDGTFADPCNFDKLMDLVNSFISFLLFTFATPIFAIVLVYTGWLYLSDQGSSEKKGKAKKILKNAIIGYIIALVAWLVVKTILLSLGFNGPMYLE